MATKWRAPTLLGAFLLCGCGGGGGGGPAPQPTTPAPSPAAPSGPLALTDTNAPDATSLVMREIEHAHMASESMLFTLDMLNYYRMTSATVPCGGSVNARLSNNDRDGSGGVSAGDVLRFEVSACSGVTRDVSMIITAIDYAARTLEGGVSFVESTAAGVRSTGTF